MENEREQKWSSSTSPQTGRERSNSDPGVREPRIIMNGNTTVPTRKAPSVFASVEVESQQQGVNTPPPTRKNKFASSIGRIFRPWKWRRKKKSERFMETSQTLERKLSVRSKREELYQKGILTADDMEKVNELSENKKPAGEKTKAQLGQAPKKAGILKPSPVSSRAPSESATEEGNNTEIRKSVGSQNVIDQLAREMARRKAAEETSAGAVTTEENVERHQNAESQENQQPKKIAGKPQGWVTRSGDYYRQKYGAANQNKARSFATDYDSTDDEQPPGQGLFGAPLADEESSSDSEEEVVRDGIVTGLASKVKRKDSLATKLKSRPSLKDLEQRNIIQTKTDQEKQERKAQVGSALIRRLSSRPSAQELRERNILKSSTAEEERDQKEEKKRVLTRKLSRRPTIQELKERKILMFNEYVECVDTVEYDRRADKPWTRLTPEDKAAIRKELNEYKSTEMEVHEDSRQYTRFHRP